MSDTGTEGKQSEDEQQIDWPEPHLDRYEPWYLDFYPSPDNVRSDKDHWDHNYGAPGELGRISIDVQFVGEDGFREMFDSLSGGPEYDVLPDSYGGIMAVQDAAGDYVAFSEVLLDNPKQTPEVIDDAMAIARDPLVAAASLRAWYDRQFGNTGGYMVFKNDHWDHQLRREEKEEWKSEGIEAAYFTNEDPSRECERCGTGIPVGELVWSFEIPPGREKNGRCGICGRALANGAEEDGYSINGSDPRYHDVEIKAGDGSE